MLSKNHYCQNETVLFYRLFLTTNKYQNIKIVKLILDDQFQNWLLHRSGEQATKMNFLILNFQTTDRNLEGLCHQYYKTTYSLDFISWLGASKEQKSNLRDL